RTRLWLLDVDLRSFANLVGASAEDGVAVFERTKHFDEVADSSASADVDPLRDAVAHADDEGTLRSCHDAGGRDDQGGWGAPDRPLPLRVHAEAQSKVGVLDV